ncbi:hypothetical protein PRIPAC_85850 [Pristionchus pacificus]|uniref:Uncharacterized protein n=1 Tax=Pristionchus pacificus TaxID=54126 RepID=A0A2A6BT49_PRIPA|nr:hypothetical protein PRIPAC_85850 [Pristionchus pacificus]|eukprot:PDM68941.1 hypothetical protein PRIPAC_47243 [Pristionchus pacificus]
MTHCRSTPHLSHRFLAEVLVHAERLIDLPSLLFCDQYPDMYWADQDEATFKYKTEVVFNQPYGSVLLVICTFLPLVDFRTFIDPCLPPEGGERAWGMERAQREGRGQDRCVRQAISPRLPCSPKISYFWNDEKREKLISTTCHLEPTTAQYEQLICPSSSAPPKTSNRRVTEN